ncbi:HAD family hydrolase [Lentzea aerocolonigenes]|uniref:HAD family hydrolase n=1 Tax=Lentzea aerocolonigenes TaxID=68170 RepID=UPI0004C390D8|nr:HAD hydrolase family protein [Lentzea aerocolonigenes]MCP2244535.1 haloacid dehalogenase-like hydrolase [Lentzea aerocolonigenes]
MKLIATDLDGTLLRNDRTLSRRSLAALRTATESGAEVVFVTARPPRFEPSYVLRMPEDAAAEHPVEALDDLWAVPFVKLLAYSRHHSAGFTNEQDGVAVVLEDLFGR